VSSSLFVITGIIKKPLHPPKLNTSGISSSSSSSDVTSSVVPCWKQQEHETKFTSAQTHLKNRGKGRSVRRLCRSDLGNLLVLTDGSSRKRLIQHLHIRMLG